MFKPLAVVFVWIAMCALLKAQSPVSPSQPGKDAVPQKSDKVMQVGGSVMPPTFISEPKPEVDANGPHRKPGQRPKFEGDVLVSLIVDKDGNPTHVRVVRSLRKDLDAQAIDAVSHYKFNPATKHGKPVAVDLLINVNFQLF